MNLEAKWCSDSTASPQLASFWWGGGRRGSYLTVPGRNANLLSYILIVILCLLNPRRSGPLEEKNVTDNLIMSQCNLIAFIFLISHKEHRILWREWAERTASVGTLQGRSRSAHSKCVCAHFWYLMGTFSATFTNLVGINSPHGHQRTVVAQQNLIRVRVRLEAVNESQCNVLTRIAAQDPPWRTTHHADCVCVWDII